MCVCVSLNVLKHSIANPPQHCEYRCVQYTDSPGLASVYMCSAGTAHCLRHRPARHSRRADPIRFQIGCARALVHTYAFTPSRQQWQACMTRRHIYTNIHATHMQTYTCQRHSHHFPDLIERKRCPQQPHLRYRKRERERKGGSEGGRDTKKKRCPDQPQLVHMQIFL